MYRLPVGIYTFGKNLSIEEAIFSEEEVIRDQVSTINKDLTP